MANAIDMGRGGLQLAPEVHDSADDRIVSLRRVVEAAKSGRAREAFGPDDWTHGRHDRPPMAFPSDEFHCPTRPGVSGRLAVVRGWL